MVTQYTSACKLTISSYLSALWERRHNNATFEGDVNLVPVFHLPVTDVIQQRCKDEGIGRHVLNAGDLSQVTLYGCNVATILS